MRRWIYIIYLLMGVVLLLGRTANAEPPAAKIDSTQVRSAKSFDAWTELTSSVHELVLPNGFRIYWIEDKDAVSITGLFGVQTGSANDGHHPGQAHLLEHMMFKGTSTIGTTNWPAEKKALLHLENTIEALRSDVDQALPPKRLEKLQRAELEAITYTDPSAMDRIFRSWGVVHRNAETLEHRTFYTANLPPESLAQWNKLLAEQMQYPVFRLFLTELRAVHDEFRQAQERFEYQLFDTFLRASFWPSPHSRVHTPAPSILGDADALRLPSLRALRERYRRDYRPDNCFLVVNGPISKLTIHRDIAPVWAKWRNPSAPQGVHFPLRTQQGKNGPQPQKIRVRQTPVRAGAVAYTGPGSQEPDAAALELAHSILTQANQSGLLDRLPDQSKLERFIPYQIILPHHSWTAFFYVPKILSQTLRNARRQIEQQVSNLQALSISRNEFEARKSAYWQAVFAKWRTPESRVLYVSESVAHHNSWAAYRRHARRISQLTRTQLACAIQRHWAKPSAQLVSRIGKASRTSLAQLPRVSAPSGTRSVHPETPIPTAPRLSIPPVKIEPILSGLHLAHIHQSEQPSFRLEIHFGAGQRDFPELEIILPLLRDHLKRRWMHGHHKLDAISWDISTQLENDRTTIIVQAPTNHLESILEGLAADVHKLSIERGQLRSVRRDVWVQELVDRKNPAYLASAALEFVAYGENSSYLRRLSRRDRRKLSVTAVEKTWTKLLKHEIIFHYLGQDSNENVKAAIAASFSAFHPTLPAHPIRARTRVLADKPTLYFLPDRQSEQARIYAIAQGSALDTEQLAAAQLINFSWQGMGGKLFVELREKRGYVYNTWAHVRYDLSPSRHAWVVAYLACEAQNLPVATRTLFDILHHQRFSASQMLALSQGWMASQHDRVPRLDERLDERRRFEAMNLKPEELEAAQRAFDANSFARLNEHYTELVAHSNFHLILIADPKRVDVKSIADGQKIQRISVSDILN